MASGQVRILAIPGDGIGKEVVPAALEILAALEPAIEVERMDAGHELWLEHGEAIPDQVVARAREVDGVLFGCTATPSPPPPGYRSPILVLRKQLGLNLNARYCRSIDRRLDVVMVRDGSEGLYIQRERAIPDGMVAEHVVTRQATEEVARFAATLARERSGRVTVVHKANVLETDAFFREHCIATLESEKVSWDEALSDAAGYHLVLNPGRYDVMLMTSHVGDLLSDVGAAVAGGLGLVPSLSIGGVTPLVEPIHGGAPDIVGQGIADPVATTLSLALLLNHLGIDSGARLRAVVYDHLADRRGECRTDAVVRDILRRLKD
ncbi:isocitrate/isopropylmalate family dehydrogenase [Haliangium sp.]|uniref:isocitrate/isopropylmalate family dehydrogenase n=1 Tax=Haliangium sp. TaxID=2663208 RepID=UPI003D103200